MSSITFLNWRYILVMYISISIYIYITSCVSFVMLMFLKLNCFFILKYNIFVLQEEEVYCGFFVVLILIPQVQLSGNNYIAIIIAIDAFYFYTW